ncbi:MAG: peptidase C39 family protein [Nocardioidaceae bacterium]
MFRKFSGLTVTLLVVMSGLVTVSSPSATARPAAPAPVNQLARWDATTGFPGVTQGVTTSGNVVRLSKPTSKRRYAKRTWRYGSWTSGWVRPRAGWSFDQVVPSWSATTPKNTFVEIKMRARTTTGAISGWKVMARWASGEWIRRTSSSSQADGVAKVATDTLVAASSPNLDSYEIAVFLHRGARSKRTPTVRMLTALSSRTRSSGSPSSWAGVNTTLALPQFSQMIHRGRYRQYGGGGAAWCSPTSLTMILGYYGKAPTPREYSWVARGYADPYVAQAARATYDVGWSGTGNWSFNMAYANSRGLDAFVTRLNDLREAERFIAAGIPLAASISFSPGQLSGAPISSTPGHLVVIVGFTASGAVVVNDPAAPSNASVQRVYNRAQFEAAWLRKSSGAVYVVHDAAHPLPTRNPDSAW